MDAIANVSTTPAETRSNKAPARSDATGSDEEAGAAIDAFVAALMNLGAAPLPAEPSPMAAAATDGQALPAALAAVAAALQSRAAPAGPVVTATATASAGAAAAVDADAAALLHLFSALKQTAGVVNGDTRAALPAADAGVDMGGGGASAGGLTHAHATVSATADATVVGVSQRTHDNAATIPIYGAKAAALPLAQPALFAERLNQQVAVMLTHNAQNARMEVNPPDLGPVEIRVSMNGDEATIQLAAPHAATRDALAEALPRLRASFADSGIALGHAGVFAELPQQRQSPMATGGEGTSERVEAERESVISAVPAHALRLGLVDAFV